MTRLAPLLAAAMIALGGSSVSASAADPHRLRSASVKVIKPTVCRHHDVLERIAQKFDHQVRHVPNLPQVEITNFYRIKERRHLPKLEDRPIERRYCHATVALSDGNNRDIWYLIEGPSGSAALGSNLEFCISGFDRWHVYGGRCRSLRYGYGM